MAVSDVSLAVFLQPPRVLCFGVVLVCTAIAALVWAAIFPLGRVSPHRAPQAPFHVSITALFALLLSFTASDAWRRNDMAYAALLREAADVAAFLQIAQVVPPEAGSPVREKLRDYLRISLNEEWSRHNVEGSAGADAVLADTRVLALRNLSGADGPVWRAALDRLDSVTSARAARLVAGGLYGDALRWMGLLALFTASAVAISLIHLEKPRAAPVALAIYVLAASMALSLAASAEHPYAGWDAVTPDRLSAILAGLQPG